MIWCMMQVVLLLLVIMEATEEEFTIPDHDLTDGESLCQLYL